MTTTPWGVAVFDPSLQAALESPLAAHLRNDNVIRTIALPPVAMIRPVKSLLRDLWLERTGVLNTQVLHEFYVNVTREIRTPLPKPAARSVVGTYARWCVDPTIADVDAAFRIEDEPSSWPSPHGAAPDVSCLRT